MVDVSFVNKTSPEANWNRQADRQTDAQDHVLSQADALTKKVSLDPERGSTLRYCIRCLRIVEYFSKIV